MKLPINPSNGIPIWRKLLFRQGRFWSTLITQLKPIKKRVSETSKVRSLLAPYCCGYGCDVGHGGDKIRKRAIGIDLPQAYTHVGRSPNDISCDVHAGIPLPDNSFDYVYSSHLIEDFEDTAGFLQELIRILRVGGNLVLAFPDQTAYVAHCATTGSQPNEHHKALRISLDYMIREVSNLTSQGVRMQLIYSHNIGTVDSYNVAVVYKLLSKS